MTHQQDGERKVGIISSRRLGKVERAINSYAVVLGLFVLDYVAASLDQGSWSTVLALFLLGATLLLALYISHLRRIWVILAALFLIASTLSAIVAAIEPGATMQSKTVLGIGGILLIVAPFVILRRISRHTYVTGETVLGGICVYLLYGLSFAFAFVLVGLLSSGGFFGNGPQGDTTSNYLFFSYSTLTTVGYGNLVPAGKLGQALAMIEALSGQIFLVIVVARLVSLWGQRNPRAEAIQNKAAESASTATPPDPMKPTDAPLSTTSQSDQKS